MDYFGNLSSAVKIWWNNKYLWVWGIVLAIFGSGGTFSYDFSGFNNNTSQANLDVAYNRVTQFIASINPVIIVTVVSIVLLVGLVWFFLTIYFGSRAEAALIVSTNDINSGGNSNLNEGWQKSGKYWARIFIGNLIISLPVFAVAVLLGGAIAALIVVNMRAQIFSNGGILVVGIILSACIGLLAIIYEILVAIFLSFRNQLIVTKDFGAVDALKKSYQISKDKLGEVVISGLVGLILGLITIPVVLVIVFLALFVSVVVIAITVFVPFLGITIGLAAILLLLVVLILIGGAQISLNRIYWTIVYKKLLHE